MDNRDWIEKQFFNMRAGTAAVIAAAALATAGCAPISTQTRPYIGPPHYAKVEPKHVAILASAPAQPNVRLGEIILGTDGSPSRERLENRLRKTAAKWGADAVYVVSDKTRVFPVVYMDSWWGPMGVDEFSDRNIVAVAVKFQ
jgi:hypothetical protein